MTHPPPAARPIAPFQTRPSVQMLFFLILFSIAERTSADLISPEIDALIQSSCIGCHDGAAENGPDFETLADDLADDETFKRWERVFDRVASGEMPPDSEPRPDWQLLDSALESLKLQLLTSNIAKQRTHGRVPARRLTKTELGYTLRDLLLIQSDVTSGVPDEVDSGGFDTVGTDQRISAVHMESYLSAVDSALEIAIAAGPNPHQRRSNDFSVMRPWHDKPLNEGGSVTRALESGDGFVMFRDVDYLTTFQSQPTHPGTYRITAEISAYQTNGVLTAKFIVKDVSGSARIVKAIDVPPKEWTRVTFDTFLQPGEQCYLTFDDSEVLFGGVFSAGGAKNYRGPGLAVTEQTIEGPIFASWPPPSTVTLLSPANDAEDLSDQVRQVITQFAPRALRRTVSADEIARFARMAEPAIDEGRDFGDAVRLPLRAILTSPQFLLFQELTTDETRTLDEHALANRLSYFLWKSLPDAVITDLADRGKLHEPEVLAGQVDRLLDDSKSARFVRDFLGQWLRLDKLDATTPDDGLYPEYDELLASAIPREPELFFSELISKNLSVDNLIESDFTFVNRRLAKLYGIDNIDGQELRRVDLPADSPRGGVLTQAAICKTTANGTTTSPVTRGNFVLTNFLGTPPQPPPPGIGSIEPDTRGQTTIREILAAHRDIETCNQCHRQIDPPGFALESFDPIGGYRTHYRANGGEYNAGEFTVKLPPQQGQPVDPSGVTATGEPFSGIEEFKRHLLENRDQVARNFISKLIVYATGGEIEFADRDEVERIVDETREIDFPVRDIVHAVVQSRLFRDK